MSTASGGEAGLAGEVAVQAGVDVAGPGAHHQALQRGQPHRRLHRPVVGDRGGRAAVAEMEGDLPQRPARVRVDTAGDAGHVLVRGAVEAVPADSVPLGQVPRQRIGAGDLGQVGEEGGVEDGDVRHVAEALPGRLDPGHGGRIVQRCQAGQVPDRFQHVVGDHGRIGEVGPAVHHPVPDGEQVEVIEIGAVRGELFGDQLQRLADVGGPMITGVGVVADLMADLTPGLADLLDRAVREHLTGPGDDQPILDRRRAGVDHQDRPLRAHRAAPSVPATAWAWIAVIATVLTMSSTVAPRERSLTGFFSPCSTGPTATAPALRWTAL